MGRIECLSGQPHRPHPRTRDALVLQTSGRRQRGVARHPSHSGRGSGAKRSLQRLAHPNPQVPAARQRALPQTRRCVFFQRALREINAFTHGVYRNAKALTPLKRRLLQELLSSKPEKEIAQVLDQKATTLHKAVRELYAEFGVKTRLALMSLWLGES